MKTVDRNRAMVIHWGLPKENEFIHTDLPVMDTLSSTFSWF